MILKNYSFYFNLMRVWDGLGFMMIGLLGIFLSGVYLNGSYDISRYVLLLFFYIAFSFSINACFDVKEDNIANKNNPIAKGQISFNSALVFSLILAFLGFIISMSFGLTAGAYYGLMSLLSFFYSSPPLRFKNHCLMDLVSHILFFGVLIFLIPFFFEGLVIGIENFAIAVSIILLSLAIELINQLRDYVSDKKSGIDTFACRFGQKNAQKILDFIAFLFPFFLVPYFLKQNLLILLLVLTLVYWFYYIRLRKGTLVTDYTLVVFPILVLSILLYP